MELKALVTIDDLFRVKGKAEIVNGEVVLMSPTGGMPGVACDEVFASLREYSRQVRRGRAVSDNKAFRVDPPNRGSFSPDAAYYFGHAPTMKFYNGAPAFAVEVRSEGDYGPAADRSIADKWADYFAA